MEYKRIKNLSFEENVKINWPLFLAIKEIQEYFSEIEAIQIKKYLDENFEGNHMIDIFTLPIECQREPLHDDYHYIRNRFENNWERKFLEYFTDYDRVIVIDCLKVNNPPGTIYKVSPDDIPNYKGEYLSLHDVQIIDIIKIANMLGKYPKVTVYGVEPQEISFGIGLTDEIQTVMPKVINYLKKEILEEK